MYRLINSTCQAQLEWEDRPSRSVTQILPDYRNVEGYQPVNPVAQRHFYPESWTRPVFRIASPTTKDKVIDVPIDWSSDIAVPCPAPDIQAKMTEGGRTISSW